MKYLKLFNTHAEYEAFTATTEFIKPNVSHCVQENEVHYNPFVPSETRLMVTYNVEDASQPTRLYYYEAEEGNEEWWTRGIDMFDKVEIDGTEVSVADLDAAEGMYQLTVGEHTVAYTLKDPTFIGLELDEQTGTPTKIGAIFMGCTAITSVTIPNSVTTIGERVFQYCNGLTSATIGSGVTSIGKGAFYGCSSLTSIDIPSGVTSIGGSAFSECGGLASVTIPDSVTTIGNGAFNSCSNLTSVTIGNGVTSIGKGAFGCCPLDAASKAAVEAINPNATGCSEPK